MQNRIAYYSNPAKVKMMFSDIEMDKIDSLKQLAVKLDSIEHPTITPGTYFVSMPALVALTKFVTLLLTPYEWKQCSLVITGGPRTGKTSLIKKFEKTFNMEFYFGRTRPGDMSGFTPKMGCIILDDALINKSN